MNYITLCNHMQNKTLHCNHENGCIVQLLYISIKGFMNGYLLYTLFSSLKFC